MIHFSYDKLWQFLLTMLPGFLLAVAVMLVGWLIAAILKHMILRSSARTKNPTLMSYLARVAYISILVMTFIIVLSELGVATNSLIAVLGAASLAIGFSLKNFLANLVAGFLIVFLRPFKLNDCIQIENQTGTVIDINLFMTQLQTNEHEVLFIPNNSLINGFILNKTYYTTKRMDLALNVAYGTNLQQARDVILQSLQQQPQVLKDPAPMVMVEALADSAITLTIRWWLQTDNASQARAQVLEQLKMALDQYHIEVPYSQLDVRLVNAAQSPSPAV